MGACLSCLPHRFFVDDGTSDGNGTSRWQRRCRRLFRFPSCYGIADALFQTSDQQDAAAGHSGPLLQSLGNVDGTSTVNPGITDHRAYASTRNVGMHSNSIRHDKMAPTLLQMQIGETQYRNSSGRNWHRVALNVERPKVNDHDGDQKLEDKVSNLPLSSTNEKADAVTSLLEDEDICPTCLDGYDQENPKILTKCGHHFHLACIFEWMERSDRCPLCDQEMIFNENS